MHPVLDAIRSRHCIRDFTDEVLTDDVITALVETAGCAPSSKNTQPWSLHLVRGAALERLRAAMLAEFDSGAKPRPDYRYSPDPLPEEWAARAKACGIGIFQHKGIGRDDREKRRLHDRENFRFFGAPHVFMLALQRDGVSHGAFMDCGFVLNNLMVGLNALGFGSCPQYSAVAYPDVLRRELPGTENLLFLAGLSFGRPKPGSHVNAFDPGRLSPEVWFRRHE
ncbi:nitroreductase [Nibricoccus sp. IMCC34717]|uniref:nitroreductase n=1 Tax=Nibricoccus sp. IMCC34717 TaxID=3034021 RepID=UPI00384DA5AA